ncbi:MAG: hypothetical protein IJ126_09905 [Lachnospiraceae bacterium]|nr:hypothetical protein [Lachnospiraceae bacterium]
MAEAKKTAKATVKKPVAKAAAETTKKAAEATAEKAAAKTTAAKTAATKTTETKTTAAKTTAAKKTTTRTAAAKTKKAAAVKENISIQFAGKDYTTEQLVKIAKDVWEFDLKKDPADFKEVQLYVKPEEAKAYYVINGTETGSFDI